ncbi:hypothetical protein PR202_ga28869 [Eleusine coracana subsp. coracana]|uniref:Uncharacterized protein n=1 Tax=Eleusine coracana subsp. coracana TaxID=191504 RepID=A0AAV5DLG0_ELECO|nr:hypothetical protein PR202_ga28869 [Eleusine coracana subsp. coracana]
MGGCRHTAAARPCLTAPLEPCSLAVAAGRHGIAHSPLPPRAAVSLTHPRSSAAAASPARARCRPPRLCIFPPSRAPPRSAAAAPPLLTARPCSPSRSRPRFVVGHHGHASPALQQAPPARAHRPHGPASPRRQEHSPAALVDCRPGRSCSLRRKTKVRDNFVQNERNGQNSNGQNSK